MKDDAERVAVTLTHRADPMAHVNPVVAVTLGWLILGEHLTPRVFVAGGVILAGVAMIVSAGGPQRQE